MCQLPLAWRSAPRRHSLEQSRETERLKLKLDVYREILNVCDTHGDAEGELSNGLRGLNWQLDAWLNPTKWGGHKPPLGMTGPAAIDLHHKVQMDTAAIITLVEKWQIIDPRLMVYRAAMNAASHDVRLAWDEFFKAGSRVLPPTPDYPSGILNNDPAVLAAFAPTIDPLLDALGVLSAYAADFQSEMQNLLLSELIQHRVPAREPLDPRYFAVTLASHEALMQHFTNETAWGRQTTQVMERTRQQVLDQRNAARPA